MLLRKYEDYSEHVNALFATLSSELLSVLPDARVEHIGSSSVPGSISKGDLDVFVGVDQSQFNKALVLIKTLGFYEKEGTFRSDELCMLVTDKFNYDVAVQLVSNGSEFEDFLRFRDLLIGNTEFIKEYNNVKWLAQSLDENEYRQKKSIFITKILNS
jgi:GrpB-like predicted nucleotidyltransferase (UPF0157 family)